MTQALDTFKANSTFEIFRDGFIRKGETAAIIHNAKHGEKVEAVAIQTATALASGKKWGAFDPSRPLKVGIVGSRRDYLELGKLRDEIAGFGKSVGWSADEIDNAMRQTLIIDREGKTGEDLAQYLRDEQTREDLDLLVICDLVKCYGAYDEQGFAKFMRDDLGGIQSGEKPCAILALVGIEEDGDASALALCRDSYKWARSVCTLDDSDCELPISVSAQYAGCMVWRDGVTGGELREAVTKGVPKMELRWHKGPKN